MGMAVQLPAPGKGSPNPQEVFAAGETALRENRLDEAERDFRQVLALDPNIAGAYANLGVVHMRRKQWPQALTALRKAEKLAPSVVGIRLNIGLVYFRQNEFLSAIGPFESVLRQSPHSYQARYLLGLCYFFTNRWTDTVVALDPLWAQASDQLNYLYVLGLAAEKTKQTALQEKAWTRLVEIGRDLPEFHLLMGKAHLNRNEHEQALREFQLAVLRDPRLPFVHFNLGATYLRMRDYKQARAEFQKDLEIEPDLAVTYEQLGKLESLAGEPAAAEQYYRKAVSLDSKMIDSRFALAKIEQERRNYRASLAQLDECVRFDKDNGNIRYFRGQVLLHMGREKEGRAELATAKTLMTQQRAAQQKELDLEPVPSPELTRVPD